MVETSSSENDFFSAWWWPSSLCSLLCREMGCLDAQVSFFVELSYNNNSPQLWQNFKRATFKLHRALASLAACFHFILFCLVLVCFLIANCRVRSSRVKCDCGWPMGLIGLANIPNMRKNTEQPQSSQKMETSVDPPQSTLT
jgi:hypothetical protein